MTQPAVIIEELDGALGVLPPSAGRLLAVVGTSSAGPLNTPATYARVQDLVAAFGVGPLVEAAAYHINLSGKPVLVVRAAAGSGPGYAGAASAVDSTALGGTSVVTTSAPVPKDDLEVVLRVVDEGTVGTAGITLQLSYDGGRTYAPKFALGTSMTLAVPNAFIFNFAAGTLKAGATYRVRTTAPRADSTTLTAALDALRASVVQWELLGVADEMDADTFDAVELAMLSLFSKGKYRGWVGNTRMPDDDEEEADYLDDLSTTFASASVHGSLYAGACRLTSAVDGRKYRRPVSFATASREQISSEEIDIADINLGPLTGVSIRDANGNPEEHDESVNPGLDDARFAVLRTWDGYPGVYVNRPRLFSTDGSDFQLMPHRRVLNLAHAALRQYFIRRLNKPIRVDATSGFILEIEALEIEAGATAAMTTALLAKPKASGVQFVLSRTDNVLSSKTLTGTARVIPLAYPEYVNLTVGFFNPALVVQAA